MSTISNLGTATATLAARGVSYASDIATAAARHGLDPRLLAAVAAQETGGPGSNGGRNIIGDGGHGRGLFQIDDRWHAFARTSAAMQPGRNAEYAATMISGLLRRFGGNAHKALSAYNAGDPNARGTATTWRDGKTLGYADSVMRHYADLGVAGPDSLKNELVAESPAEQASIGSLFGMAQVLPPYHPPAAQTRAGASTGPGVDFASVVDAGDDA